MAKKRESWMSIENPNVTRQALRLPVEAAGFDRHALFDNTGKKERIKTTRTWFEEVSKKVATERRIFLFCWVEI